MKLKLLIVCTVFVCLNIQMNGQSWTTVSGGVGSSPGSSSVDVLCTYKNVLLAAGRYESIKQWDGTTWSDFSINAPSSTALFVDGDTIYSGRTFTGGGNNLSVYNGSSWSAFGNTATYDSISWNTNNKYTGIFKFQNHLCVTWTGAVMWYDPALKKFRRLGNSINDIGIYTSGVKFSGIMNNKAYFSAYAKTISWDGSRWDSLNTAGFTMYYPSGSTVINNELYIAGYFIRNGAQYTLVKYDGTNFTNLIAAPPTVYISDVKSKVLFTYYDNASSSNFIGTLNGNTILPIGSGTVTTNINAMAIYNNELYVGGFFNSFAGFAANNIVKIGLASAAPAAPSGLAATPLKISVAGKKIRLNWIDNSSNENGFKIERSTNGNSNWIVVNTLNANSVQYIDTGLVSSSTYYYRALSFNSGGSSAYSNTISATTTAVNEISESLFTTQIAPNPFTDKAVIHLSDGIQKYKHVVFAVYDLTGKEVKRIPVNGTNTDIEKAELKTGVYFYKLLSDSEILSNGKFVINSF